MTRKEVELKIVEYAKSVDWDFEKVCDKIGNYYDIITLEEWECLDGQFSDEKIEIIFKKYKPKTKYTIEDLRNGKVAVLNDGSLEELRDVLKLAFPYDRSYIGGNLKYYYLNGFIKEKWDCSDTNAGSLPTQSVKDFLSSKEEFKWGDHVEILNGSVWVPNYVYIGKHPQSLNTCVVCFDNSSVCRHLENKDIRKPQQKTTITRSEIAEKFGIPIDQLEIKD